MSAVETRAAERFAEETAEHTMSVLRDDDLYRHLRFQKPGTSVYYFDLVTWPGYLAIVGDAGDYLFSRTRDMFEFFRSSDGRSNPDYWSEKLQGPEAHRSVRVFSPELYRQQVLQWLDKKTEELEDDEPDAEALKLAVDQQLLSGEQPFDRNQAVERLHEFEHDGTLIYEPYEWGLTEFDGRFLWCCHAIVWGIEQYQAAKCATPEVSR